MKHNRILSHFASHFAPEWPKLSKQKQAESIVLCQGARWCNCLFFSSWSRFVAGTMFLSRKPKAVEFSIECQPYALRASTSSRSGALCSGSSCPMCRHCGMDRPGIRNPLTSTSPICASTHLNTQFKPRDYHSGPFWIIHVYA